MFFKKKSAKLLAAEEELHNIRKAKSEYVQAIKKAEQDLASGVNRDDTLTMLRHKEISQQDAQEVLASIESLEHIVANGNNMLSIFDQLEATTLAKIEQLK